MRQASRECVMKQFEHGSDRHYFTDLDYGIPTVVLALIGDQVGCGGGESRIEMEHRLEIEVADGVVVAWSARWEGADATIYFDANETTGSEKAARYYQVL